MCRDGEIQAWDLPEDICSCCDAGFKVANRLHYSEPLSSALSVFEKQYICRVIEEAGGNKTLAAKMLGISRKTLWEKCKAYSLLKRKRDGRLRILGSFVINLMTDC